MKQAPRKHEQQVEKITDVARALFAKKGYSETSLADIAKAMRFRKASLYYYFSRKDDILERIFQQEHARGESILDDIPTDIDLRETLYAIATKALKVFEDPKSVEFMRLMIGEGLKNGRIQKQFFKTVKKTTPDEQMLKLIRNKVRGEYTDREMLNRIILFRGALFTFMFHTHVMSDGDPFVHDEDEILRCLCDVYAKGW